MAPLLRLGSVMIRSGWIQNQRHMASTTNASDPIQRLFLDKVNEFKSSKRGLDDAHQKAMSEEVARLKRVFKVDESKLTQLDVKLSSEASITLRDIDENKDFHRSIATGEYQKQLQEKVEPSPLLAAIPPQLEDEFHFPTSNKPMGVLVPMEDGPDVVQLGDVRPDYEYVGGLATPEKLADDLRVHFGSDMPTIDDDKDPQRDTVNFPSYKKRDDTPPTRFHFVPESFFQFFYPKTGATGPYLFVGTFGSFLLSKELLVYDHNLAMGISSAVAVTALLYQWSPLLRPWLTKMMKKSEEGWENWRMGNIELLKKIEDHYNGQLNKREIIDDLYISRRQDINNQLELEHRSRLNNIYLDAKRRLDYLVALKDSQRQMEQRNMVNWVLTNALGSIGPKQEAEVLDTCISQLKQMSSKHARAI